MERINYFDQEEIGNAMEKNKLLILSLKRLLSLHPSPLIPYAGR